MSKENNFIVVKCSCGNEQTIFSRAATTVSCVKCTSILAAPTGGKAKIIAKVVKVVE